MAESTALIKAEIVAAIAEINGLSKNKVGEILDSLIELIIRQLSMGHDFRLNEIGTFKVKDTPARAGRNPTTGESITIPARKRIVFKPTPGLKNAVQD